MVLFLRITYGGTKWFRADRPFISNSDSLLDSRFSSLTKERPEHGKSPLLPTHLVELQLSPQRGFTGAPIASESTLKIRNSRLPLLIQRNESKAAYGYGRQ